MVDERSEQKILGLTQVEIGSLSNSLTRFTKLQLIQAYAKRNNIKYANNKQLKNDVKALKSELIYKNDYVILREPYKNKKHNNMKYGWVVMKVQGNYAKRKCMIQNIITGEQLTVNKGRIKRFHQPLFKDPKVTLDSEAIRIGNLDRKQAAQERNQRIQ